MNTSTSSQQKVAAESSSIATPSNAENANPDVFTQFSTSGAENIILRIFLQLSPRDRLEFGSCNKLLHRISWDPYLERPVYIRPKTPEEADNCAGLFDEFAGREHILTRFDLSKRAINKRMISNKCIRLITTKVGTHLRHLNLGVSDITDETLKFLSDGCPELQTIIINKKNRLTIENVAGILRQFPKLTYFDFSDTEDQITPQQFQALLGCPKDQLKNFEITETATEASTSLTQTSQNQGIQSDDDDEQNPKASATSSKTSDSALKTVSSDSLPLKRLGLVSISLSNTQISPSFSFLTNLRHLTLRETRPALRNLHPSICNLTLLRYLDLSYNELLALPSDIGNLKNLNHIDIGHNQIRVLPDSFCNLNQLRTAYLGFNMISALPEDIGNLTRLWWLEIDKLHLTTLPESIGNMSSLLRLTAYHNQLTKLPDSIGNLKNVVLLWLSHNQITSIPETINGCTQLDTLWIDNNLLTSVPKQLGECTNICRLWLEGNPLPTLPIELVNLTKCKPVKNSFRRYEAFTLSVGSLEHPVPENIIHKGLPATINFLHQLNTTSSTTTTPATTDPAFDADTVTSSSN